MVSTVVQDPKAAGMDCPEEIVPLALNATDGERPKRIKQAGLEILRGEPR